MPQITSDQQAQAATPDDINYEPQIEFYPSIFPHSNRQAIGGMPPPSMNGFMDFKYDFKQFNSSNSARPFFYQPQTVSNTITPSITLRNFVTSSSNMLNLQKFKPKNLNVLINRS